VISEARKGSRANQGVRAFEVGAFYWTALAP